MKKKPGPDEHGKSKKPVEVVVEEIFAPHTAIGRQNFKLFSGRMPILRDAMGKLGRPGSSIVLYGERGSGKTSLGKVLMHLVAGDLSKNDSSHLPKTSRIGKKKFGCVWKEVDTSIDKLEDWLYRVLQPNETSPNSLSVVFPKVSETIRADYERIDPEGVFEPPSGTQRRLNASQKMVHALFDRVEQLISDLYPMVAPIFFMDEVDQLKDPGGLGKLMKNRSSSFVLIGISNTVSELVQDHKSSQRKIAGEYLVPRLTKSEVEELFSRATQIAEKKGVKIDFSQNFLETIFLDSAGIPGLCQRTGAACIDRYKEELSQGNEVVITKDAYLKLLERKDIEFIRDSMSSASIDRSLAPGTARWAILKELGGREPTWFPVASLDDFDPKVITNLQAWLKELVDAEVLEFRDNGNEVRFASVDLWAEVRRRIQTKWLPGNP